MLSAAVVVRVGATLLHRRSIHRPKDILDRWRHNYIGHNYLGHNYIGPKIYLTGGAESAAQPHAGPNLTCAVVQVAPPY